MRPTTASEILKIVSEKEKAVLKLQAETVITGIESLHDFSSGLAFYSGAHARVLKKWEGAKQGLILASVKFNEDLGEGPFLLVEKPRMTFVYLANIFSEKKVSKGIHPMSVIDPEAKIGEGTEIGPYAVIGKCSIGTNCIIGAQTFISDGTEIKNNVRIFSNCVIGEPGLGSVVNYDSEQILFPHTGKAVIMNNVVIGAGTHVNCGTLSDTVIHENAHISTNCLIAHNCIINKGVYIAATAKVAGSVKIGEKCYIGFGAVITDGIELAEGVTVGIGTTVMKSCLEKDVTLMNQPQIKNLGKLFSIKRE